MFNISKLNFIKLSRILVIAFVIAVFCIPLVTFLPEKYAENLGIKPVGATTVNIDVRVSASAQDSSQKDPTGVYDNTLAYEIMGKSGTDGSALSGAMLFTGITIPAGATITSAYIQFTASADKTDTPNLTIKGEDTATPSNYGASEDFTSRTYTTASVSWTPSAWTTDSTYNTDDISSIVTELCSSYTYSSGSMAFEVLGYSGSSVWVVKKAYSYDGSTTKAALLHITYTYSGNNRYWVGDTGDWSDATNHWATTSGGTPDIANLPDATSIVHFDAASFTGGSKVVTVDAPAVCASMDWTGATNTPDLKMTDTITVGGNVTLISGMTLSGAAAIIVTGTGNFDGAGLTIPKLQLNGSAHTLSGANSFTDLTRTGTAADTTLTLGANQTVTGTFTANGNSINNRLLIQSSVHTTQRTVTAAAISFTNVDFHDTKAAGASADWDVSAITGGSVDYGGNSNIIFSYDRYWVGGTGNWSDAATHWAFSSGGTPDAIFAPSATLNVHFDANSGFTAPAHTLTISSTANCNDMDWTNAPNNPAISMSGNLYIYGDATFIAGMTTGATSMKYIYFNSGGVQSLTTNGITIAPGIRIDSGGTLSLQDNLTVTGSNYAAYGIEVGAGGTLTTNNKNITVAATSFILLSNTATLNAGSSTISTGYFSANAGCTINAGTSTIIVSANSYTISGGGKTYNILQLTGSSQTLDGNNTITTLTSSGASVTVSGNNTVTTGTFTGGGVTLSGTNSFVTLNIAGTAVLNDTVTLGANQTITTTLNIDGNSSVNRLLVKSNTMGTARTLTLTGATVSGCTNVDFLDITATPAIDLSAITGGSGDLGGNTGITFTTADDIYWVGNSGLWSASLWADSSGGVAGSGRMPLAQDTAIFDENSFTVTNRTVTVDVPYVGNINALDASNYGTIYSASTVNCYGSISLGAIGFNPVSGLYMYGRNSPMIGCTTYNITGDVYLYPYGTTLTLSDDLYLTGTLYLRAGTFDCLAHNVLAGYFDSSTTTYTRVLSPDGAIIQLNGTSATTKWNVNATNFTLSANTCLIIFTNSTSNGQTFTGGTGITNYYGLEITGTGDYTTTFSGANTFAYIYVDRTESHKTLAGNVTLTVSAFIAPAVGTTTVTITNTDFSKASGTVVSDYLVISGSSASGGASFYAGANATDSGGNSGWTFTDAPTPIVSTLGISNLGTTTITLNGSIDTLSGVSGGYAYFEYGLTASYGYETTHVGKSTVGSFTADVSGLNQGNTYHYRAVFTYSGGTVYGNDLEFITVSISGAAVVYTSSAINVGNTTATLVGTIITLGNYTNALGYFEYGTTTSYEKGATPVTNLTATGSYSVDLTSLETETEYHFRAVLYYGAGYYAYGADRTFTTSGGLSNVTIIQINGVDVYKNAVETGDMIFFVDFTVLYGTYSNVYVPSTPISEAYFVRLMDSVGDEVMSATPFAFFDNGYNRGLVAMYATAAEVTSLGIVWGDDYSVKIYGNPTAAWTEYPIPASSVFNSFIWRPDASVSNQRAIIAKRIVYNYANVIQVDWAKDTTHYTYANYGLYLISNGSYYLTSAGQTYFGGVIPYLTTIAPSILGGYVVEPDVVDVKITHNTSWQTSIDDMTEHTIFGVARTKLGTLITGVSGRMVTGILWLLGMLVIIIAAARKINSFKPAILLSFPLLIFGILVGWIPILVGLGMAFLFGAASVYIFTWEKSSS